MKSRFFLGLAILSFAGMQAGCTIDVVQSISPSFPNAAMIQRRVGDQKDNISQSLNQGNLDQESAFLISQNDDLILRFMHEDQTAADPMRDLDEMQMATLNGMIDDNSRFIDDAIQNHQAWLSYFQGESFEYANCDTPYLYLTYLDHQLRMQKHRVDSAFQSHRLSDAEARELKDRIHEVQIVKDGDYRANGHLDLSEDQVRQLSFMADDNAHYIRFLLGGRHGHWDQGKFNQWKNQRPLGLAQEHSKPWSRNATHASNSVTLQPHAMARNGKPMASTKNPAIKGSRSLPSDPLTQLLNRADQNYQQALKSGHLGKAQAAELKKKLAALHAKANADLKKNRTKSVTQDQMKDLSALAKGIK